MDEDEGQAAVSSVAGEGIAPGPARALVGPGLWLAAALAFGAAPVDDAIESSGP